MTKKCGCCNNKAKLINTPHQYSNVCTVRDCYGKVCSNCNYCNICYNCNCHKFPGHFMSVERLKCKNSCLVLNYSFTIKKC